MGFHENITVAGGVSAREQDKLREHRQQKQNQKLVAWLLEEAELDEIPDSRYNRYKRAIEIYAQGVSMEQASLEMGMSTAWLRGWRRNHPEEFETLVVNIKAKNSVESDS